MPVPLARSELPSRLLQPRSFLNIYKSLIINIKMAPVDSARIQEAGKVVKTDPRKAESQYKEIISKAPSATSDAAVREYETALISLGELYRDEKYVIRI